jgi:hypothetical protein
MDHLSCIPFYVGCQTNKGQLIGVSNESLLIRTTHNDPAVEKYEMSKLGTVVVLHLKKLSDLTHEESVQLINNGFNIGRPRGYSFSPEAFLFLVKLHVDLFGLIQHGFAKDLKSIDLGA